VSAEFAIRSPPPPSMVRKRTTDDSAAVEIDPRFARVVAAFARNRRVSCGGGKGFGSGALKVNGKIFAMMDSKGRFVVKLSRARVDALVAAGQGAYFDPGHGRKMKEWAVIAAAPAVWPTLAEEAYAFVRQE